MTLTREQIKSGWVQRMAREMPHMKALTDEEMRRSREATLATNPTPGDDWIIGYGSLIWNPAFEFDERLVGRLRGWHRRFCMWTALGRGSPELPGLMLALEPGGSCRGIVLRIPASKVEEETDIIWRREMVAGSYRPRWVKVDCAGGEIVHAIAFVMNRRHERYAGRLPDHVVIDHIARAVGRMGPCFDYLHNTVEHLHALGIRDPMLEKLHRQVAARRTR